MKQYFALRLILQTAFIFCIITGCQKTETDPCEGLLSESPPVEIIVKFVDKQTHETLLVDPAEIIIKEKKSGSLYKNWHVYNRTGPLNGAISLPVFSEKPGEFQYQIKLGEAGTVLLYYQISRKESDNPCRTYSFPVHDVKIVDQPFDVFQYEGKAYPRILVVGF